MVPLAVEFVIVVVDVSPPAVVMREYRHSEKYNHWVSNFILQYQIELPLWTLVQSDHTQHDQNPYF